MSQHYRSSCTCRERFAYMSYCTQSSTKEIDNKFVKRSSKCECRCVGHVKALLEQQLNVTQATVNLTTETALVRVLIKRGSRVAQQEEIQKVGQHLAQVSE